MIIIAVVEGLTEFLPISSTAHMGFIAGIMGVQETDFLKMFQISIQFGAILAVVVAYWKKFFNFSNYMLYLKLAVAVIPALILGKLFDEKIEAVLGNQIVISVVLVLGGIILLFVDKWFKKPKIFKESQISFKRSLAIGFWQCLAMMPGTSRSAASIIGGMSQRLSRKMAAEFSFFLAVPTMLAATLYSLFIKNWGDPTIQETKKGFQMLIDSNDNMMIFVLGNIIAFLTAILAVKLFISLLNKYGFKFWGWYRIVIGVVLICYFYFKT